MPATDALQPPVTPDERQIVKDYGGWTGFTLSFGLKPWEKDDAEEGLAIVRAFTDVDADSEETSPAQEFEASDSAAYESETEDYEADKSQSDSHQSDSYQSDSYQSDNYQSDNYQSDHY